MRILGYVVRKKQSIYNALPFDKDFIKNHGLIAFPMVEATSRNEEDANKPYYVTKPRTDILGKIFNLKITEKAYKKVPKTHYYLKLKWNAFPFTPSDPVHFGDWIVTDKNGCSEVYSPDEFKKKFVEVGGQKG